MENVYTVAGINDAGDVVVDVGQGSRGVVPVVIRRDTHDQLTVPAGIVNARATGVNSRGEICGVGVSPGSGEDGLIWKGGVGQRLPTPKDAASFEALSIGDDGTVIGISIDKHGISHGVEWMDSGKIVDLGPVAGFMQAASISGRYVIYPTDAPGSIVTSLWHDDQRTNIAPPVNSPMVIGHDVNGKGDVVGYFKYPRAGNHGFLYSGSKSVDLGTLPNGVSSQALAVNEADDVVGNSYVRGVDGFVEGHAVLWTDGKLIDVNLALDTKLPGILEDAKGINSHGAICATCVITGSTYRKDAYLLEPVGR